jgi:hypothetical protein
MPPGARSRSFFGTAHGIEAIFPERLPAQEMFEMNGTGLRSLVSR